MSGERNINNNSGLNHLTRWKIQLESNDREMQSVALAEIIESITNVDENNRENVYKLFINSDICHFLNELLIYQDQRSTNQINKIFCHLSETHYFYRNDFQKILRVYLRLINSFSMDNFACDSEYKRSILNTIGIIVKRARERDVNFSDDDSISKISLLLTAKTISESPTIEIDELDFINLIAELLTTTEMNNDDKKYQLKNMTNIVQLLDVDFKKITSSAYFLSISKVIHQIVKLVSINEQTEEEGNQLISIACQKFMEITEFILVKNQSDINYEIFCNLFYYILSMKNIRADAKQLILNRFFTLNGLNFIIKFGKDTKSNELLNIKSRVIIAQLMFNLSEIFLTVDNEQPDFRETLMNKFLNISFNGDYSYKIQNQRDEPTGETLSLALFINYININWKKSRKSKGEILSFTSLSIQVMKSTKFKFDISIFSMLVSLYTSNFENITIKKNELLKNSSTILVKYSHRLNLSVDLKFAHWWLLQNIKIWSNIYEKFIMRFISITNDRLERLTEHDKSIFDLRVMIIKFLQEETSIEAVYKITNIISNFSINLRDYEKFLRFYKKKISDNNRQKSIYALEVMCMNSRTLNKRLKADTAGLLQDCLNNSHKSLVERTLVIQLCVSIMETMNCEKISVRSK